MGLGSQGVHVHKRCAQRYCNGGSGVWRVGEEQPGREGQGQGQGQRCR